MNLKLLNTPSEMSLEEFVGMFGGVYENSPWVAEGAHKAGLDDSHNEAEALSDMMSDVVQNAPGELQLQLLQAHPDLAGKLAQREEMTEASKHEQAGAGLDQCTPEEFQRFHDLNDTYKKKFGFPYILAITGYHRPEILENFEQRVLNNPKVELKQAIAQVDRIAKIRIHNLMHPNAS